MTNVVLTEKTAGRATAIELVHLTAIAASRAFDRRKNCAAVGTEFVRLVHLFAAVFTEETAHYSVGISFRKTVPYV